MSLTAESRIKWRCRRGLRELDLVLRSFVDQRYAGLTEHEQLTFARLLEQQDMELYDWLMGRGVPADPELASMVTMLLQAKTPLHS